MLAILSNFCVVSSWLERIKIPLNYTYSKLNVLKVTGRLPDKALAGW